MGTVRLDDTAFPFEPRETVLQAALRAGIAFPSSCRVGGCGTCKCKLVEGEVTQLTETGYLLSGEELEAGYILACQSVPRSDLRIEVDLDAKVQHGTIVAQDQVTHDITRLTVQLERALAYQAGQFTNLRLGDVARSYSFATPPREDGRVCFFVRKVPGGALSTALNDERVVGRRVQLDGAHGDFWLREGEAPLVMVAGGSGLPPILAMLQQAHAAGVRRAVTVLFGAREQRDLYALDELDALAKAWHGNFCFVPVLSSEPPGSPWTGARGLVTQTLKDLLEPGSHAYLCGPPGMVDAAVEVLRLAGVARPHIHFDRFTTRADLSTAPAAGVLHYVKFFLFHAVGLFALAALLAGGHFTTWGLLAVLGFYTVGDALLGDDVSTPRFTHPLVLTVQLWLALPLLLITVFASVWSVCAGDPLGFGATVTRLTGLDVIAARDATTFAQHLSGWVLTGLMIGLLGTISAHELTHRTWDRVSMFIGRWLLAFSFDTSFAIEHVYGHHRYVATLSDPATAPRGRSVYFHIVASTWKGNLSAWHIEAGRLRKKKLQVFSLHNAFLRGHAMSALLVALAFAMGGPVAAAYFTACGLLGKALLEIVNYMEHYGIVRDPATPVQPRHSWNTNRRLSSWTMFNLTRHSHHHAMGEVPYHELAPYPDAPMMINGYLTTIVVALVPPVWRALMTPKVEAWDRDFASADERALVAAPRPRASSARPPSP